MLIIGLTGGIGSGKTTVSDMFSKIGIPIIDTDVISRDLINNTSVLKKIVEAFGDDVIDSNGTINRKKLSKIVFTHPTKKKQLEKILHPEIRIEVNKKIQDYSSSEKQSTYIIIVIPLLLETGYLDIIDRILTVISDEDVRIKRVKQRDNRETSEIQSIIKNQVTDEQRLAKTDDIIKNNNDINDLESKIKKLHDSYTALSRLT